MEERGLEEMGVDLRGVGPVQGDGGHGVGEREMRGRGNDVGPGKGVDKPAGGGEEEEEEDNKQYAAVRGLDRASLYGHSLKGPCG